MCTAVGFLRITFYYLLKKQISLIVQSINFHFNYGNDLPNGGCFQIHNYIQKLQHKVSVSSTEVLLYQVFICPQSSVVIEIDLIVRIWSKTFLFKLDGTVQFHVHENRNQLINRKDNFFRIIIRSILIPFEEVFLSIFG